MSTEDPFEPIPATTELLAPNSTWAIYQDALAEATTTESDAARALLRDQILEVRRLQDLLDRAKQHLTQLRAMSPRELAARADCTVGRLIEARRNSALPWGRAQEE